MGRGWVERMSKISKCVLLTGVSGKFGQAFARDLLIEGHRVIGTARSLNRLQELLERLSQDGISTDKFVPLVVDFNDPDAIRQLVEKVLPCQVDVLVNNARSLDYLKTDPSGVVSRENFMGEYLMDVVVPYELGMALASQEASILRHIINIGSQYGSVAANLRLYDQPFVQSPIQYSVAKAALVHLTRELGVRLASREIQVNCISYGGVEGRVDDNFKRRYAELSPIGRMLHTEEVSTPLLMLIERPSMCMTGHTLHADGGWSLW